MLERRAVERGHLSALFALKVRPDQAGFVAPNEITLAQAAYEPASEVWGLWDSETAVGLLAMIRSPDHPEADPVERDAAYVWRLMIGAAHQGHGYGRAAIGAATQQAEAWGLSRITLHAVDRPGGAIPFYEHLGFRRTGRALQGEQELTAYTDSLRAASAR